jgi:hypothetical protein
MSLDAATLNKKTSTWNLRAKASEFRWKDSYLLRATFTDRNGKTELGFGPAYDASTIGSVEALTLIVAIRANREAPSFP